jgi:D-glycero-D-manno-heptose 1,7-bisphosphate phosphatase
MSLIKAMSNKKINQAVILAGGQGMRLRPLTNDLPKPMVLVGGRPFLEYLVELLRDNGIEEIVMLLGYLPEKITDHFDNGEQFNISIKYSIGGVDELTGTRVRNAAPLLADEFLLLYGDNYWPMDLEKLVNFYREKLAIGTIVTYSNIYGDAEHGRQNNLRIATDGRVTYYGQFSEDPNLNGVDIGFFLMKKEVIQLMPDENFSFEQVILPKLIEQGGLFAYLTDHPYHAITTVEQLPAVAEFLRPKRVVFLDRDGVINKSMPPHEYVKSWEEFEFLPGALPAIAKLTRADYQIYIVTNQRGIARGLMSESDLTDIHQRMTAEIVKHGGRVAGIYYCPHGDNENCDCRKPKLGLFFRVAREHQLDLTKATLIGDSDSDQKAGEATGCRTIILKPGESLLKVVNNLLEAVDIREATMVKS